MPGTPVRCPEMSDFAEASVFARSWASSMTNGSPTSGVNGWLLPISAYREMWVCSSWAFTLGRPTSGSEAAAQYMSCCACRGSHARVGAKSHSRRVDAAPNLGGLLA